MINLIKSTFYHEKKTKTALCNFIKQTNQLSIGTQCAQFEKSFSKWQKRKYTTLFNTGSSANLALIQALLNLGKLSKNAKVGFSGITWATNVMPLIQLGLSPVPVDIEIATLNISPATLKSTHAKHKLDCLFLTNLLGFADDIRGIRKFCEQENILLIEDNCESLGSEVGKQKLGNFSLAATFSFFVGHHMSAIEGGAVGTDNEELDRELRMVRSHGWDRHLTKKQQQEIRNANNISDFDAKYTFYDLAYNVRPTEITGFLGLQQLKFLPETIQKRAENFTKFCRILEREDLFYPIELDMNKISNFAMPLICKSQTIKNKCIELCKKNKIEIRPIVGGVISEQPFFTKYIHKKFTVPNSHLIHTNGFYFGNNPELTQKEIKYIVNTFTSL